jgi:predicted enzyme related to lactoylglutathione lyase
MGLSPAGAGRRLIILDSNPDFTLGLDSDQFVSDLLSRTIAGILAVGVPHVGVIAMVIACLAMADARAGRWRTAAAGVCALLWSALLLGSAASVDAAEVLGPESGSGERYPGKFVWFDLVTDEPAAASRFYQSVFGWSFRAVPGAPASHTIIENAGGGRVAGMLVRAREQGSARGARWLTLISVPDVAAAARYATQNGGSVVMPPAGIGGRGTHALLRDPEGALFGVLHTERGDPPDTPVSDDDFFWVDLFAREPERAARFYAGLAGYEISVRESDVGLTRLVLQSQGYARGGIVPRPADLKQSGWLPYVLVNDVVATLEKVTAAQGRILVKPDARLLDGNVAVIADPLGGVLGIVNWESGAADGQGEGR